MTGWGGGGRAGFLGSEHGLINDIDTKAKCCHLKRDFAARVYQSLWTGDTVSHVGIFDPVLRTVAPLPLSLVQLSPLHPFRV